MVCHGVSCCAEIGRPTYAFATLFGPFLLIFVDFHHSAVTSIFSHSNLLKMSQISKCYSSSSLSSIKILSSMIERKFQSKQFILLRFSIFAIKKKEVAFCVKHHSKFMFIEYAYSSIYGKYRLILSSVLEKYI